MPQPEMDLWPPSVGHRVLIRDTRRTGTIQDIVMDGGEAKYRVTLDFLAGTPEGQRLEEGLFTLGQLEPYLPP